jgi:hypothetical protein
MNVARANGIDYRAKARTEGYDSGNGTATVARWPSFFGQSFYADLVAFCCSVSWVIVLHTRGGPTATSTTLLAITNVSEPALLTVTGGTSPYLL